MVWDITEVQSPQVRPREKVLLEVGRNRFDRPSRGGVGGVGGGGGSGGGWW